MKDDAFIRGKNPMTKMEVRNTILDYLALLPGQTVLDIGAGTGSVIVSIKKFHPDIEAHAIEYTDSGCSLIAENARIHDVQINIHKGYAPLYALDSTIQFDRVYVGGTGKKFHSIVQWLETHHLKQGAILVFSVLTIESQQEILAYLFNQTEKYYDIEASHIQVSRLEKLSEYHYFKPLNPCVVIKCVYGGHHG